MSAGQRVFLVDGQAVYLEGDGDITEDVLQQALAQLAAGGAQTMEQAEPETEAESVEPELKQEDEAMDSQEGIVLNTDTAGDEEEGVLAILQDETGQQQTVRLTPDQAAALGIDYQQLLAAASATGADDESDAAVVEAAAAAEPAAADPVPAEQTSAQEVASLATSVVLDLNESQPSLVNQSDGGDKVTYTFEVVDKDAAAAAAGSGSGQQPPQLEETGLLTKSRDIMVPRVRTGDTRQLQQQIHRTAAQVLRTDTPSAPIPRDPVTGGYISSATLKKGPVYNTGPNSLQNKRRTVINTANTVQQKLAQTSAAPSMPSVSATTISGDPSAVDMDDDVDDLPVILTPVSGSEQLPDFIEPRPGMKILVRPLEMAAGASGDGPGTAAPSRAVGSSENPIQLVQQGNTFKSLQPLSSEQLKQIATVLQQSRLNVPSNSKNSLYDADTNTRIVYRVVYPEDVGRGGRGRGRRGRPRGRGYQSRRADDGDVDWSPELSRYEKAERKRLATKTRTGRVSKPPKHMVKDYRRIHRLDFDEPDLDDSDGGYSEWDETAGDDDTTRDSTELSNDASAAGDSSTTAPGGGGAAAERLEPEPPQELAPRPKRPMAQALRDRFTCRTCNALCIGYMRLEAHFTKYPDHERPVYVPPKTPAIRRPAGRPGGYRYGRGRGRGRGAYVPAQPVAKRPRLDGEASDLPPLSVDDVLAQLMALSGGSVERLCESMSAVLEEFRYHVRSAVTPTPAAERPTITAAARTADGPVLKVDEERSSLTGLPTGTYVLWPIAPSADDTGESALGDAGEASSESPTPSQAAARASPSAATALGEAVLAAVSEEGSPTPATAPTEQNTPDTVTKQEEEEAVPVAATESPKGVPPTPVKNTPPPPAPPTVEPKSEPPSLRPAEKDVLSAAEISQMALSAAEGTEMPPPAEVAPPPAPFPAVGGSETELAAEPPPAPLPTTNGRPLPGHRGVSDVLDEFVDGLVDAPEYALISGEPVADIDSAQIQLKLADSDAAAGSGGMPLLGDGR